MNKLTFNQTGQLRPLSDLCEEIEFDGNRIIPIVELAKIAEGGKIEKIKVKSDGQIFGVKYLDSDSIETVLCYHKEIRSFVMHTPGVGRYNDVFHLVSYQLDMFQKLFEWNFDVYGTLNQGTTIK